jgi:cytochrome c oxidase subunit III
MAIATPETHATHHDEARMLAMKRAGLWLFFFSECILFGLLLTARFFLAGIDAEPLDQEVGLAITVILLLSSVTAFSGETAIRKGRNAAASWWFAATIALGFIFAAGVAYEWSIAHFSRSDPFGTAFFAMTGTHALHVLSGLVMFILLLPHVIRGRYTAKNYFAVQAVVMYWHFVDVVWVIFYPALYLVQGVD